MEDEIEISRANKLPEELLGKEHAELIKKAHRSPGGELYWRRDDIAELVEVLRARKLAILGGEVLAIDDDKRVHGSLPLKEQADEKEIFQWSAEREEKEAWEVFVKRSISEASWAIHNLDAESMVDPKLADNIYYNITFLDEMTYITRPKVDPASFDSLSEPPLDIVEPVIKKDPQERPHLHTKEQYAHDLRIGNPKIQPWEIDQAYREYTRELLPIDKITTPVERIIRGGSSDNPLEGQDIAEINRQRAARGGYIPIGLFELQMKTTLGAGTDERILLSLPPLDENGKPETLSQVVIGKLDPDTGRPIGNLRNETSRFIEEYKKADPKASEYFKDYL